PAAEARAAGVDARALGSGRGGAGPVRWSVSSGLIAGTLALVQGFQGLAEGLDRRERRWLAVADDDDDARLDFDFHGVRAGFRRRAPRPHSLDGFGHFRPGQLLSDGGPGQLELLLRMGQFGHLVGDRRRQLAAVDVAL